MGKEIFVGRMQVLVIRKNIKNMYLRVCPPEGDVRVTAPFRYTDAVRHGQNTDMRQGSFSMCGELPVGFWLQKKGKMHFPQAHGLMARWRLAWMRWDLPEISLETGD